MSIENKAGYVDTVKSAARVREAKVAEAIGLLCGIINTYAFAGDTTEQGEILIEIPEVYRTEDRQGERAWFTLSDGNKGTLTVEDFDDPAGKPAIDKRVGMMLGGKEDAIQAAQFTMYPPNVLGHDGIPLSTSEIGDIMVDLERYKAAAQAGHFATPIGAPIAGNLILGRILW